MNLDKINQLTAEVVMGFECFVLDYFGTEGETPRQGELESWLFENDLIEVGEYWIDVESGFWIAVKDWQPTTDLVQAFKLYKKLLSDDYIIKMRSSTNRHWCDALNQDGGCASGLQPTINLAICICALLAYDETQAIDFMALEQEE